MRRLPTLLVRARRKAGRARRRAKTRLIDGRDALVIRRARRRVARHRTNRDAAVLIHLYYPEVWPLLAAYVSRLAPGRLDVFVTIPRQNRHAATLVRETFPDAHCLVVPNRGRDVLPFLVVADVLGRTGYQFVLKIHSKKSEHFGGGDHWRDQMLEELLPEDPTVLGQILDTLALPGTGMVGPRSTYFPLNTYWAGNAPTVKRLLSGVVSAEALARLEQPRELGFFAGTMFWARLDALEPLLGVGVREFVREPTPKDGTMSHALERAMPVLPELLGRDQYDTDGSRVAPRPALADVLPDWYRDATKAAIAAAKLENGGAPAT